MYIADDVRKAGHEIAAEIIEYLVGEVKATRCFICFAGENPDKHQAGEEIIFLREYANTVSGRNKMRTSILNFIYDQMKKGK